LQDIGTNPAIYKLASDHNENQMNTENQYHPTDRSTLQQLLTRHQFQVIELGSSCRGGCQIMAPVIERLRKQYSPQVQFSKLDMTATPWLQDFFHTSTYPTFLFIYQGRIVDRISGSITREHLHKAVQGLISSTEVDSPKINWNESQSKPWPQDSGAGHRK